MSFDMTSVANSLEKSFDYASQIRQKEIDATEIQLGSTAEYVAYNLYREILKYQENLKNTEDVAMKLVQFSSTTTILVKEIGYSGYNLICFYGEDTNGKPLELIQHIQQLNFLLMVVPKIEPEVPKRNIGFVGQVE